MNLAYYYITNTYEYDLSACGFHQTIKIKNIY